MSGDVIGYSEISGDYASSSLEGIAGVLFTDASSALVQYEQVLTPGYQWSWTANIGPSLDGNPEGTSGQIGVVEDNAVTNRSTGLPDLDDTANWAVRFQVGVDAVGGLIKWEPSANVSLAPDGTVPGSNTSRRYYLRYRADHTLELLRDDYDGSLESVLLSNDSFDGDIAVVVYAPRAENQEPAPCLVVPLATVEPIPQTVVYEIQQDELVPTTTVLGPTENVVNTTLLDRAWLELGSDPLLSGYRVAISWDFSRAVLQALPDNGSLTLVLEGDSFTTALGPGDPEATSHFAVRLERAISDGVRSYRVTVEQPYGSVLESWEGDDESILLGSPTRPEIFMEVLGACERLGFDSTGTAEAGATAYSDWPVDIPGAVRREICDAEAAAPRRLLAHYSGATGALETPAFDITSVQWAGVALHNPAPTATAYFMGTRLPTGSVYYYPLYNSQVAAEEADGKAGAADPSGVPITFLNDFLPSGGTWWMPGGVHGAHPGGGQSALPSDMSLYAAIPSTSPNDILIKVQPGSGAVTFNGGMASQLVLEPGASYWLRPAESGTEDIFSELLVTDASTGLNAFSEEVEYLPAVRVVVPSSGSLQLSWAGGADPLGATAPVPSSSPMSLLGLTVSQDSLEAQEIVGDDHEGPQLSSPDYSQPGWYYTNEALGSRILWTLYPPTSNFTGVDYMSSFRGAYAVVTAHTSTTELHFGITTFPVGAGDAEPGAYRSFVVFYSDAVSLATGTTYVVHAGMDDAVLDEVLEPPDRELPRVRLDYDSVSSVGPALGSERILAVALGTSSIAPIGSNGFWTQKMGYVLGDSRVEIILLATPPPAPAELVLPSSVALTEGASVVDVSLYDPSEVSEQEPLTVTGLPAWLELDTLTGSLALASGVSAVPSVGETIAYEVSLERTSFGGTTTQSVQVLLQDARSEYYHMERLADGSRLFWYPLYATQSDAELTGDASHTHLFLEDDTGTTWYMPNSSMHHGVATDPNAAYPPPEPSSVAVYSYIPSTWPNDVVVSGAGDLLLFNGGLAHTLVLQADEHHWLLADASVPASSWDALVASSADFASYGSQDNLPRYLSILASAGSASLGSNGAATVLADPATELELLEPPQDSTIYAASLAGLQVAADGDPAQLRDPSLAQTSEAGWYYDHTAAESPVGKINWYLYASSTDPAVPVPLSQLAAFYAVVVPHSAGAHLYLQVLTQPQEDGENAEASYRSRVTFTDFSGVMTDVVPGTRYLMHMACSDALLDKLPTELSTLPRLRLPLNALSTQGPVEFDEALLYLTIGSNSESSAVTDFEVFSAGYVFGTPGASPMARTHFELRHSGPADLGAVTEVRGDLQLPREILTTADALLKLDAQLAPGLQLTFSFSDASELPPTMGILSAAGAQLLADLEADGTQSLPTTDSRSLAAQDMWLLRLSTLADKFGSMATREKLVGWNRVDNGNAATWISSANVGATITLAVSGADGSVSVTAGGVPLLAAAAPVTTSQALVLAAFDADAGSRFLPADLQVQRSAWPYPVSGGSVERVVLVVKDGAELRYLADASPADYDAAAATVFAAGVAELPLDAGATYRFVKHPSMELADPLPSAPAGWAAVELQNEGVEPSATSLYSSAKLAVPAEAAGYAAGAGGAVELQVEQPPPVELTQTKGLQLPVLDDSLNVLPVGTALSHYTETPLYQRGTNGVQGPWAITAVFRPEGDPQDAWIFLQRNGEPDPTQIGLRLTVAGALEFVHGHRGAGYLVLTLATGISSDNGLWGVYVGYSHTDLVGDNGTNTLSNVDQAFEARVWNNGTWTTVDVASSFTFKSDTEETETVAAATVASNVNLGLYDNDSSHHPKSQFILGADFHPPRWVSGVNYVPDSWFTGVIGSVVVTTTRTDVPVTEHEAQMMTIDPAGWLQTYKVGQPWRDNNSSEDYVNDFEINLEPNTTQKQFATLVWVFGDFAGDVLVGIRNQVSPSQPMTDLLVRDGTPTASAGFVDLDPYSAALQTATAELDTDGAMAYAVTFGDETKARPVIYGSQQNMTTPLCATYDGTTKPFMFAAVFRRTNVGADAPLDQWVYMMEQITNYPSTNYTGLRSSLKSDTQQYTLSFVHSTSVSAGPSEAEAVLPAVFELDRWYGVVVTFDHSTQPFNTSSSDLFIAHNKSYRATAVDLGGSEAAWMFTPSTVLDWTQTIGEGSSDHVKNAVRDGYRPSATTWTPHVGLDLRGQIASMTMSTLLQEGYDDPNATHLYSHGILPSTEEMILALVNPEKWLNEYRYGKPVRRNAPVYNWSYFDENGNLRTAGASSDDFGDYSSSVVCWTFDYNSVPGISHYNHRATQYHSGLTSHDHSIASPNDQSRWLHFEDGDGSSTHPQHNYAYAKFLKPAVGLQPEVLGGAGWSTFQYTMRRGDRLVLKQAALQALFARLGDGQSMYIGLRSPTWSTSSDHLNGFRDNIYITLTNTTPPTAQLMGQVSQGRSSLAVFENEYSLTGPNADATAVVFEIRPNGTDVRMAANSEQNYDAIEASTGSDAYWEHRTWTNLTVSQDSDDLVIYTPNAVDWTGPDWYQLFTKTISSSS